MIVRVRNFQSLKDVTLDIQGLTVVTGPNNSGKSALMRAIRGVFENSPSNALVRYGEKSLTVDLTFNDGQTVTWEKGPKTNDYTINGYKLQTVGRGVPTELEDLGVKGITCSNTVLWPQIARQFQGTLFLVNQTGAILGEALSDVDKVGKLNKALRLGEKDKRSVSGELKVRRKDLKTSEERLSFYDGFEQLEVLQQDLQVKKDLVENLQDKIKLIKSLQLKQTKLKQKLQTYTDLDSVSLPDTHKVQRLSKGLHKAQSYLIRYKSCKRVLNGFKGLHSVSIPQDNMSALYTQYKSIQPLHKRHKQYTSRLQKLGTSVPQLPTVKQTKQRYDLLLKLQGLLNKKKHHTDVFREQGQGIISCTKRLDTVQNTVQSVLQSIGKCPLCDTIHSKEC